MHFIASCLQQKNVISSEVLISSEADGEYDGEILATAHAGDARWLGRTISHPIRSLLQLCVRFLVAFLPDPFDTSGRLHGP